ncbi:Uncharacterised protein [Chlamydia trachomatis]|nr:Uncharacterised protein [Chlamydia trachomatis]CRH47839.1 Uncharacterised protein [Chlamydia trachomatis]
MKLNSISSIDDINLPISSPFSLYVEPNLSEVKLTSLNNFAN